MNLISLIDYFFNSHNQILDELSDWWKKYNLINNELINKIPCKIKSKSFSELSIIKSKIKNLSQFKNIQILTISYNENIELFEFYGDFSIIQRSLKKDDINIILDNECIIELAN